MVDGISPEDTDLLALLHLAQPVRVARFRGVDVRFDDGQAVIHIETRTGGGNRNHYSSANATMIRHPWYDNDADDEGDPTYAHFWFRVPPSWTRLLRQVQATRGFIAARDELEQQRDGELPDPGDGKRVRSEHQAWETLREHVQDRDTDLPPIG